MNKEWLRNLAHSHYGPAGWECPGDRQARESQVLRTVFPTLRELAEQMVATFNAFAPPQKQVRVMKGSGPIPSLLFCLGTQQLRLTYESPAALGLWLLAIRHFVPQEKKILQWQARFDHFGGLRWTVDGNDCLTHELMIQRVLQILWESSFTNAP